MNASPFFGFLFGAVHRVNDCNESRRSFANNCFCTQWYRFFEFAGSLESAVKIIRSWDEAVRILAAFSIGLDFLFLILYSTTIGLACLWS